MIAVAYATFFKLLSTDFLLPYSDHQAFIPPIPIPSPHFGLISNTDHTKRIQLMSMILSTKVFIIIIKV